MSKQFTKPSPKKRTFIPADFKLTHWASLKPFYDRLLIRDIHSVEALAKWLSDRSELEGIISEDAGWRYIHMTCDTTHEAYRQQYEQYIQDILPQIMPLSHQLDEKAIQSPYIQTIRQEKGFNLLVQCLEENIRLYQPKNIPLLTKLQIECQNYSKLVGAMTVEMDGKELTLQQAATYLESTNRAVRQEVYEKINQRRLQDKDAINDLYSTLVQERHQVALNAGFANFRDYAFVSLKRFDYAPKDCFAFHQGIEATVVPFMNELAQDRQAQLGVDMLKPWDHAVDPTGQPALRPFHHTDELLQKTIQAFDQLDHFLGDCLRTMQDMQRFDLDSRKGKAPGGYNYPLEESGVPFIFMNAAANFQDMITMLHEGGYAVHSFLMHNLLLNNFKHITSEMAELASMSMELLTMDQWHLFFEHEDDVRRAKKQHLEHLITRLAWIATIDQFQHWVYENPHHTHEQRKAAWNDILARFSDQVTSWSGQETFRDFIWQKQLHLFEVPFYYIEYGIAQLGAIAVWRNFQQNTKQGLANYLNALKLGYTCSLPEMYQTAGIRFDLSPAYIQELMEFVREQWQAL
jgi:oligoendopeptidase F